MWPVGGAGEMAIGWWSTLWGISSGVGMKHKPPTWVQSGFCQPQYDMAIDDESI